MGMSTASSARCRGLCGRQHGNPTRERDHPALSCNACHQEPSSGGHLKAISHPLQGSCRQLGCPTHTSIWNTVFHLLTFPPIAMGYVIFPFACFAAEK